MSKGDFDSLKNSIRINNEKLPDGKKTYFSRIKYGYCRNEDCYNKRRAQSAYCQACSDKHNKIDGD